MNNFLRLRSKSHTTWLVVIILVSVGLRFAAAIFLGNSVEALPGTSDQVSYHNLALRVGQGYGFTFDSNWWPMTAAGAPTAHWSFLYTFYLVAVYAIFGVQPLIARLIQALIVGILHPYLTFRLGARVFNARTGLVAAGLVAVYAYFVYYTATLMTEPFYIVAILAALFFALRLADPEIKNQRGSAVALGVALGVTVLLRQLFLLFIPFLFLWLWWVRWRQTRRVPIGATVIAGVIAVAMILPFTVYNAGRFHRFVLLNTNAGYAFFWGNHPIYGTHFLPILPPELGTYQDLVPQELRHLDEAALDQALLQRGLGFIRDDPGRYVLLSLSRVPAFFMFWPSSDSGMLSNVSRVLSFGLLWPFMLGGILLTLWRTRWRAFLTAPASLLLLFATVYTVVHLLSWALIRYRLPVDAVLVVFAATALVRLWVFARGWRGAPGEAHSGLA